MAARTGNGWASRSYRAFAVVACSVIALASLGQLLRPAPLSHERDSGKTVAPHRTGAADAQPQGYTPKPEKTEGFLRSLPKPLLRDVNPHLFEDTKDRKPVLLYRALYEAYAKSHNGQSWVVGRQGIGDCVSWGWAHGADIHLAVLWKLGLSTTWKPAATEAIYGGSRVEAEGQSFGGWSDGSYGGAAAKWVRDWGILFRQPYPDQSVDLTRYSAERAKDWGAYGCGGRGDSGKLDAIAKKHPVRHVALVTNFAEAAEAISNGYPVPVCSGQGFTSQRDQDGFCRASGSWSHCMCFVGVRFEPRPGLLCLNSWGPDWVSGPKWPSDQPEGSFWVDASTATRMLSGRDSFAVSGYEGFPARNLDNGDWVLVEPRNLQERYARHSVLPVESVFALAP